MSSGWIYRSGVVGMQERKIRVRSEE